MITPLADRILIEQDRKEDKTVSGIYIPDTAQEKPLKGTIVKVGPGTKDEEMLLKAGERILFGKHAGISIADDEDNKEYVLMRQADVLAKIQ